MRTILDLILFAISQILNNASKTKKQCGIPEIISNFFLHVNKMIWSISHVRYNWSDYYDFFNGGYFFIRVIINNYHPVHSTLCLLKKNNHDDMKLTMTLMTYKLHWYQCTKVIALDIINFLEYRKFDSLWLRFDHMIALLLLHRGQTSPQKHIDGYKFQSLVLPFNEYCYLRSCF